MAVLYAALCVCVDSQFALAAFSCRLCLVLAGCPPASYIHAILTFYWRLCHAACVLGWRVVHRFVQSFSICIGGFVVPLCAFVSILNLYWRLCHAACVLFWRIVHRFVQSFMCVAGCPPALCSHSFVCKYHTLLSMTCAWPKLCGCTAVIAGLSQHNGR